jgi:sigma-B regulation protein RsbU (phosphoserine phosphatase)
MSQGKHIVLAEDAAETRNTFVTILRKAGYEVTPACDGREALATIMEMQQQNQSVDLLITDIKMAGLDGLQLTEQLAKMSIRIPTLAMTGYGNKEIVIELMRRGVMEYIEKPFEAVEMLECVAKIFKRVERDRATE